MARFCNPEFGCDCEPATSKPVYESERLRSEPEPCGEWVESDLNSGFCKLNKSHVGIIPCVTRSVE